VDVRRFALSAVDNQVRRELGLEGKLVLGFSGFVRAWHGLPRVLDTMAALSEHPELHLLVVGDGPGRAEIEARAQALDMTDRLTILGVVKHDRVGAYIAAFDIALQPHVVDYASPLKLFEYMALGRAIIAPDQPNIREILRHERDALLFNPADSRGFEDAILRLCADSSLRATLGEAAVRTVEHGQFSWDNQAAKVEKIALRLLDAARGRKANADRVALSTNDR
jgi:glycosyltransferase involved in cell wall biosynthesis